MLKINKQEMTYSCLESNVKIYQKDKDNADLFEQDSKKFIMMWTAKKFR